MTDPATRSQFWQAVYAAAIASGDDHIGARVKAVGLVFGIVVLVVAMAARTIRKAQDQDRLCHEQRQLQAATEQLSEIERARELRRWNNPDAAALAVRDRTRTGMRIGKMLD